MDNVEGIKAAPASPIAPRIAMSMLVELDKAPPREKSAKEMRPIWSVIFLPIRSPMDPNVRSEEAKTNV
jgi:hypothetical protein